VTDYKFKMTSSIYERGCFWKFMNIASLITTGTYLT